MIKAGKAMKNGLLENIVSSIAFAVTDDGFMRMNRLSETQFELCDIKLNIVENNDDIRVLITGGKTPIKKIILRWSNIIESECKLLTTSFERSYGDLEWQNIRSDRMLPWYFLINDKKKTRCLGVKTQPSSLCSFFVSSVDITLCIDVASGSRGVILDERVLTACELVAFESEEEVFDVHNTFAKLMCPSRKATSFAVYGGNNWYYAYGNSCYQDIIEDSKLMSSLALSNKNRPFMVIDDGWQQCHSENYNGGPWEYSNYKFGDMRDLVSNMKEIGVRPGIWFRPLQNMKKTSDDYILKSSDAYKTLDPSVEGVLKLVSDDIKRLKEFGFELIKHDFSTWDIFGLWGFQMGRSFKQIDTFFSDRRKTTAEIIKNFYRAIRASAGSTPIIGCNTISHLSAGIFEIQRTGDDTSGKNFERTRIMGINTLAFNLPVHKVFYDVDADCVPITKELPRELTKNWLKLVSESGTPLFISLDRKCADNDYKKEVEKAFSIASEKLPTAKPLDFLDTRCPKRWKLNNKLTEFNWEDINKDPTVEI